MINDFKNTHHQKTALPLKTSNSLDNSLDNSTNSNNNTIGITSPPHFYSKRPKKLHLTRFKLFPKNVNFFNQKLITKPLHFLLH